MYNRVGYFYVSPDIRTNPFAYKALFNKIIVLKVENDYMRDRFKYTVACELFDEVDKGSLIPEYVVLFDKDSVNPVFEKTDNP